MWFSRGILPKSAWFRFKNYSNLPRYMLIDIDIHWYLCILLESYHYKWKKCIHGDEIGQRTKEVLPTTTCAPWRDERLEPTNYLFGKEPFPWFSSWGLLEISTNQFGFQLNMENHLPNLHDHVPEVPCSSSEVYLFQLVPCNMFNFCLGSWLTWY